MKKREIFAGILRYLKPHGHLLALTVFSALVVVAGQLLSPYFAGKAIDCILGEAEVDWSALRGNLIAIALSAVAAALFQWVMSFTNNRIAFRVLAQIRGEAFSKLSVLPLRYVDNRAYGDIANVIVTDAEQFSEGLLLGFTQLFTGVLTIAGVLGIMLAIRWEIALVVFCITPLSFFVARFIAARSYHTFKAQTKARAEESAFVDEMIGNLKVVKAFSREDENAAIFAKKNEALREASLKAVFFPSITNPTTRFVNSLVYAAVALTGGLLTISTAGMGAAFTVGNLTTFLSYANQYTKPFNEISEVFSEFQNSLACAGRLFALINEQEEPSDAELPSLGEAKGEVVAEKVSFSYDPARPLIEHFNLQVKPGMRVAIVGPTGCGKTTLINLLMRFYDVDGGAIFVDGRDIREITRDSLRKNFGMVLQETWLKTGTVRENLVMGAPDCTEEEMIEAAKTAKAHSFILRLPEGYDTVISDEGVLSAGQKQLLCIARVMLCRPPMLILDEATSNIDTHTEKLVQEAFAALMRGRTSFIVAHRLSTIQSADLILVMNAGNIVEQGTHAELLARGGYYSQLYHAQFAR
ncbi:MAG: ABC transporter ATP-binding protein [Clostridia bacterium]|nr:ABC transporter ATP-binding protein [Clostridia bacterium]